MNEMNSIIDIAMVKEVRRARYFFYQKKFDYITPHSRLNLDIDTLFPFCCTRLSVHKVKFIIFIGDQKFFISSIRSLTSM